MTRGLSVPGGVPAREARGGLLPRVQRWVRSGGLWSLAFGAPLVLVFAYFSWGPIVRGLVLSFQKTNFLTSSWVGLHNFEYVLTDPVLPRAILNTVLFTAIGLLVGAPLPLALAVVMSELRRWKGLYSALAYLPVVIPPVVAILLWKVLYMPGPSGLLNSLLGTVGLGPLAWLDSEQLVIPSMVLAATWAGAGTSVIIYLAALGGVRPDLYEAAELDGAGVWSRVWHVTLPQIRGVILVLILLQLIGTMQVFNEPNSNYGAAAALSVMLAAVLAIVSIVFQFSTRRLNEND